MNFFEDNFESDSDDLLVADDTVSAFGAEGPDIAEAGTAQDFGFYGEDYMDGFESDRIGDTVEPSLIEELEIDFGLIAKKILVMLNPFSYRKERDLDRILDMFTIENTDIGGPLMIIFAFGILLMLGKKILLGAIYGFSILGCATLYFVLKMMAPNPVSFFQVFSISGYGLIYIVLLALLKLILFPFFPGLVKALAVFFVGYAGFSTGKLYTELFKMKHQLYLVIYPNVLLFLCFSLLALF